MSKIIVALDRMSMAKALELAEQAKGLVWGFKVNDLLLHYGAEIVYKLKAFGNVMADPKLYDIPNTIKNSVRVLKTAGADIITVHASANYTPQEDEREFLAGITVLTSFDEGGFADVYNQIMGDALFNFGWDLTSKNYRYMVCSGQDLKRFDHFDIKTICPGIRPSWYQDENDDQQRKMTPKEAVDAGADLLVMGRPLVMAEDFVEAIKRTKEEIGEQI
jgi:orotidine-5'-phosphate decarboxylase